MEKSKKGKIVFGIIVGLVLLSGTYALAHHLKSKKNNLNPPTPPTPGDIPPASTGGGGSHDPVYTIVSPLHTSAQIKAFQNFANSKGAGLTVDGVWGPHTAAAWAAYGGDFSNQGSSTGSGSTKKNKFDVGTFVYAVGIATGFDPSNSLNMRTFPDGAFVGTVQSVDTAGSTVWYLVSTATNSKYNVSEKYLRK